MASSAPDASNTSIPKLSNGRPMKMRGFLTTSEWVKANIEDTGDKRLCMIMVPQTSVSGVISNPDILVRCSHPGWHSQKTSTESIALHFLAKHGISSPVKEEKKSLSPTSSGSQQSVIGMMKRQLESSTSASVDSAKCAKMSDCFSARDDVVALAFAMNPTHALDVIDDPFWRLAFGSALSECSRIKNRATLTAYIKELSDRLEKQRSATLRGIIGLQQDAGKDVNSRKLVACCYMHPSSRMSFVHKLLDTEQESLTEEWHRIHSALRQAMSPDLTEAYIRIRWNFAPLMQYLNIQHPPLEPVVRMIQNE